MMKTIKKAMTQQKVRYFDPFIKDHVKIFRFYFCFQHMPILQGTKIFKRFDQKGGQKDSQRILFIYDIRTKILANLFDQLFDRFF